MTRTKDLALEYQEQQYDHDRIAQEHYESELAQLRHLVPPIDLGLMEPSPATSEQIANGIIEAVKEGRINPIELAVKKKCISDALELAFKNDEVKRMVVGEVEKYGKEGAAMYGATIKVTSTGKYQYDADPKWRQLNESIAPALKAIKEQEDKIKTAVKNNCSLVDENGEIIASIVPCPKTDTVAVSFKKK